MVKLWKDPLFGVKELDETSIGGASRRRRRALGVLSNFCMLGNLP